MPLLKRRTAAATLYDRCEQLFAANPTLVNMSNGCCDGYLGLVSPDEARAYSLTFYRGKDGYYTIWDHPDRGGDTTSFMHAGGEFTQRGVLSLGLIEWVIATHTPVRLGDE